MNWVFIDYDFNRIFSELLNWDQHEAVQRDVVAIPIGRAPNRDMSARASCNFPAAGGRDSYFVRKTLVIIPVPFGDNKEKRMLAWKVLCEDMIEFADDRRLSVRVDGGIIAQM